MKGKGNPGGVRGVETVVGKTRNSGEFPGPRGIRFDDILRAIFSRHRPCSTEPHTLGSYLFFFLPGGGGRLLVAGGGGGHLFLWSEGGAKIF